jgi:hypothetical protein
VGGDTEGEELRRGLAALRRELEETAVTARFVRSSGVRAALQRRLQATQRQLQSIEELALATSGTAEDPTSASSGEGLQRKVMLRLLTLMGESGSTPEAATDLLADLGARLQRRGPVDGALLDVFSEATDAYAREFGAVPPAHLLELLRTHVNRTAGALDLPMTPQLRSRLAHVVSEAACLAGWTLHACGRRGEAHAYFTLARDVARDSGHHLLQALALGSMASLFSTIVRGTPSRSRVAQRLLEQATALVPPDVVAPGVAWLHGRLAEEHAALGERTAFVSTLERARTLFGLARQAGESAPRVLSPHGVLSFWGKDGPGPDLVEGFGLGVLGDARGVDVLVPQLAVSHHPVDRTIILGDLATAHLRQGDCEQAVSMTIALVDESVDGEVLGRLDRARGLRAQFLSGTPGLAELDERLAVVA